MLASFKEMLISSYSRTVAPAHSAKTTSKWFVDHDITVLDWPANIPDLNTSMGYFQEKDEKRSIQQSRRAEGSIVPRQCHRLIASMPHLTDAGICAKGARAGIECINEHTLKNLNFSVLQILFLIDLSKYSKILRYWFLTFIRCKL